ncbi:hypothetical protein [Haloarcula halophila]|uniref:hypothetical protein n=1 Tax=Haloarcula TaxID=2237 RepID=UPI0023E3F79E|nr:hypothetical protein [Halomicroarcula sp. DFY41]
MTRIFRVLTALLVVASALVGAVGPAAAVPSDAGTETWTLSPSSYLSISFDGSDDGSQRTAHITVENDTHTIVDKTVPEDYRTYTLDVSDSKPVDVTVTSAEINEVTVGTASAHHWKLDDPALDTPESTDSGIPQYEFEGVNMAKVDLSEVDSEATVTVSTWGVPSKDGRFVLARETYSASEDGVLFKNGGAYESYNISVDVENPDGTGEPEFENFGDLNRNLNYPTIGVTGGDDDMQCDPSDRLMQSVNPWATVVDCTPNPGTIGSVDTSGLDAQQVKTDIYSSATAVKSSTENYHTTQNNHLQDTATKARILGKQAYIRALNNGSSESVARLEAKDAVQDYYATKQKNIISQWETQVIHGKGLASVAKNESEISDNYASRIAGEWQGSLSHPTPVPVGYGDTTTSITLANGETMSVLALDVRVSYKTPVSTTEWDNKTVGPTTTSWVIEPQGDSVVVKGAEVKRPNSDYNNLRYIDFDTYANLWSEIESQNTQIQNEMDTLVNNTYDSYQSGDINNSDLYDPYVSASRSPGDDFQTWVAGQLVMSGQGVPDNFSTLGAFNITTENGNQYTGILTSPENPPSGQFEVNRTYNPDNINGTQYVILSERYETLESNFTIHEIRTVNNQTRQNVTIEKTTYETANVSALKKEIERLQEFRAEQEARENNLDDGAGGGIIGSGGNSAMLLVLAGAVVALILAGGD